MARRFVPIAVCGLFCLMVLPAALWGADKRPPGAADIVRQVTAIEKKGASYRRIERDIDEEDCLAGEGSFYIAYFDGAAVRKVVARFYGERSMFVDEYYYNPQGDLIFAVRSHSIYEKPIGAPPEGSWTPKTKYLDCFRFYFKSGKLLGQIPPVEVRDPDVLQMYHEEMADYARDFHRQAMKAFNTTHRPR